VYRSCVCFKLQTFVRWIPTYYFTSKLQDCDCKHSTSVCAWFYTKPRGVRIHSCIL